jgi:flagellar biosynthesis protein FlhB
MPATDFADRTLPATDRRRREARARGELARSPELTAAVVLIAASVLIWSSSTSSTVSFLTLMKKQLSAGTTSIQSVHEAVEMISTIVRSAALLLWPLALVLVICGAIANILQTGLLWVPSTLLPRIRWRPILSWSSSFESTGPLVRLAILSTVTVRFWMARWWQIHSFASAEQAELLTGPATLIGELSIQLSLCLVAFALIDYGFRYWRNEQNLRMTIEELRREQRDDVIDPGIKKRRSNLWRP